MGEVPYRPSLSLFHLSPGWGLTEGDGLDPVLGGWAAIRTSSFPDLWPVDRCLLSWGNPGYTTGGFWGWVSDLLLGARLRHMGPMS